MILVTGAAGLIGSSLLRHLAAAGEHPLVAVDTYCRDGRASNLSGVPLADFLSRDDLLTRIHGHGPLPRLHAVVHLGACTSTLEADASMLMRNNFSYTQALAKWCLGHGVRFIYASSAATYGDGQLGYGDDLAILPRLCPLNKYALSKHAVDLWALHAGAFAGPGAITGLKYFNVYGPGENHKGEMRSMVLKAYEQVQSSGRVQLFKSHRPDFGDGEQRRDFLYVKDAAAITAWFLHHPEATGIYNVGSGTARTWNDLVAAVFAALGREPHIEYIDMPASMRAAYQYATCADLELLHQAGCLHSCASLEAGVTDYVRGYLLPRAG